MDIYRLLYSAGVHKLFYLFKKINGRTITVACFHRVNNENDFFCSFKVNDFERMIKYFTTNYIIISFSELENIEKKQYKKPLMVISFDDGYKDFIIHALPVLKKYDVPSNHNIVVDCTDGKKNIWTQDLNLCFNYCRDNRVEKKIDLDNFSIELKGGQTDWFKVYYYTLFHFFTLEVNQRSEQISKLIEITGAVIPKEEYMNWDDVRNCMSHKVEIGSHTMSHDVLSTIKNKDSLLYEIKTSKEIITEKLKTPVTTLCYPNGQNNEMVNTIAKEAGYRNVLYSDDKIYHFEINSSPTRFISRMSVYGGSFFAELLRIENFQSGMKRILKR